MQVISAQPRCTVNGVLWGPEDRRADAARIKGSLVEQIPLELGCAGGTRAMNEGRDTERQGAPRGKCVQRQRMETIRVS